MNENDICFLIRGSIFDVYNNLGPGLLEFSCELALNYELNKRGLESKRQVGLPLLYDGKVLGNYRIDILVNNLVIIEIKSVSELLPVHHKQVLTYLKLSKLKLGILVNFNQDDITKGIFRKVNSL